MKEMLHTCWRCGCPTRNIRYLRISDEKVHESSLCDACSRKLDAFFDFENRQFDEEQIICPYCGYEEIDSWEYEEGSGEFECPECGHVSNLEVEVKVSYTTKRRIEDMPSGYEYREFDDEC